MNNFGFIKKLCQRYCCYFIVKKELNNGRLGKLLVKAYYFNYFEIKLYQTTRNIINLIRISIKPKNSNQHIRDLATNRTELSEKPCT